MIRRIFLMAMMCLPVLGIAQELTASPYSFNGIGEMRSRGTNENRAMGEITVYQDSIHLNLQDPSSLGALKLTNYSLGVNYNSVRLRNADTKVSDDTAGIDYLAIAFPITSHMGVGFGLAPRTAVGYQLQAESINTDLGGEREQINTFSGDGGVNQIFLSAGYAITKKINFGVTGRYSFGTIENENIQFIEDVEFGTRELYRSTLSGWDFKLGVNYKDKLTANKYFAANIVYNFESRLNSENSQTITSITNLGSTGGSEQVITLGDLARTKLDIPYGMSFGFGVGEEKKWFLGANYFFNQNSNFEDRFFNVNDNVIFEDALKVSLGGFYIPKYDSFTSYWSRVVYRAGLRFEDTGLVINGEQINDFGISFGIGLPVSRNFSNFNLGFDLGRRGTQNADLIQENYFNIRLSVSLNDRWFQKRKFN